MQDNTEDKNEKLFYRFRSTGALLDDFHELENEEIYFSPAKDLNDPLEGYMDLSFDGDEILWTNFFQNYLLCLFTFRDVIMLTGNSKELTEADIHAYFNSELKEISSTEGHSYKMVCDVIFANATIRKMINYFSSRKEAVSQDELLLFLQYLHFYFLDVFVEVDVETGLMKRSSKGRLQQNEIWLENLNGIIDSVSKNEDNFLRLKALMKFSNTMNDSSVYLMLPKRILIYCLITPNII